MLSAVVAQTTTGETGGFDIFGLLLPLALAFLLFSMFRRQRKAQKQVKDMRTQMEPGTEVMTQFGLFGTIVSIDQENNKAVLELSPGNHATVHTQALAKVVEQVPATVADDSDPDGAPRSDAYSTDGLDAGTTVPDDASSIDGRSTGTSGATGTGTASTAGSTSTTGTTGAGTDGTAGTAGQADRDALNPQDPKTNRDN